MIYASRIIAVFAAAMLLLAASAAAAEYVDPQAAWNESGIPATPPSFDMSRLIQVDAPHGSSLKYGIDPNTLSISDDGVVRYVVVASSAQGAVNALYEGIRCSTGEYRLYARHSPESGWSRAKGSEWQSVFDDMPSKHPLAIARAGVCIGRAPNGPLGTMLRTLRSGGR